MTEVKDDRDLILDESLDFEPECDSLWHDAERPSAEWAVERTPCRKCGWTNHFLCNSCHEYALKLPSACRFVYCSRCEFTINATEYRILWSERIK